MDDQGVFRYRARGVLTGSFDVAGSRADEDQSLCRLSRILQRLCDTRLHIGAKRKTSQYDRQFAKNSPGLVKDRQHVFGLPASIVVDTGAAADPAKVRA